MNTTLHSNQRMKQRGVSQDALAFALQHGHKEYRQGQVYYMVLDRQIRSPREEKYRGLVVVTSADGWILTVWRDQQGLKKIRHRPRRRSM